MVFGRVVSEKSVCQHFDKYTAKANSPQNGCNIHCKEQIAKFAKSFVLRLLCGKAIYLRSGGRVVVLPPILGENHTLSCPLTFFEGLVLLPSKHSVFINEQNERKTKNDFRSFCSFF